MSENILFRILKKFFWGGFAILWPPDAKSRLIGKDPEDGKDWGQEEKTVTEDEMVRWHHRLNGHEFEQILGESGGQEAWHAVVCGVAKSQIRLSDWATTMGGTHTTPLLIFPVRENIPLGDYHCIDWCPQFGSHHLGSCVIVCCKPGLPDLLARS